MPAMRSDNSKLDSTQSFQTKNLHFSKALGGIFHEAHVQQGGPGQAREDEIPKLRSGK